MFKSLLKISAFFIVAVCCSVHVFAQATKRKLIWSEEFNYTGLADDKKWSYDEGNVCPKKFGWCNK